MSNLRIFFIIIFLCLINLTCDKGEELDFPYVAVDLQLNIATDLYNPVINSSVVIPGAGIGGIIIFKGMDDEYFAFDMACTYEIANSQKICSISKDNSEIIFKCPCCGSKFTLDLSGIAYPRDTDSARHVLHSYPASTDGIYVYVRN